MPAPTLSKVSLTLNKRGNKKNFFTLVGTGFVVTGGGPKTTLKILTSGSTTEVWPSDIVYGKSTDKRLVCHMKHHARASGPPWGTETIDITVTNPDTTQATLTNEPVDVIDENDT